MICYKRISLLCCAASGDVSVSAFRARMTDAVSAGASAAVEELAFSPPTKKTSSISVVAAGDAVRSVSFLLGGTVIGVEATWFEWGSNKVHAVNGSSQCAGCGRGGFCCCCSVGCFVFAERV